MDADKKRLCCAPPAMVRIQRFLPVFVHPQGDGQGMGWEWYTDRKLPLSQA